MLLRVWGENEIDEKITRIESQVKKLKIIFFRFIIGHFLNKMSF